MFERMSQKFESFEQQLKELDAGNHSVERERRSSEKRVFFKLQRGSSQEDGGGRRRNTCFLCGKEGHWKRECTLNFKGSAPTVEGGWRDHQTFKHHSKLHVPLQAYVFNISSLLRVKGQLEGQMVECLLDSGAGVCCPFFSFV